MGISASDPVVPSFFPGTFIRAACFWNHDFQMAGFWRLARGEGKFKKSDSGFI